MSRRRAKTSEDPESTPASPLRQFWNQFGTLFLAVLLALAVRTFVIEPYRIPSGSMFPTLLVGDHLFVNKFIYGIKIPGTDWRLPGLRDPQRGDVVVFTVARGRNGKVRPADAHPDLPRDRFVKRIVGVPGDTIEVRDGVLFVNGAAASVADAGEVFQDENGRTLRRLREDLAGYSHEILDDPRAPGPARRPIQVEPGRYFMMGDNRDYSNDSRNWGTVRLAELKGPAFVLYWSWNWDGGWTELLNPVTWWRLLTQKMRWDRIGDGIQ